MAMIWTVSIGVPASRNKNPQPAVRLKYFLKAGEFDLILEEFEISKTYYSAPNIIGIENYGNVSPSLSWVMFV
jgi:hypothetical protein